MAFKDKFKRETRVDEPGYISGETGASGMAPAPAAPLLEEHGAFVVAGLPIAMTLAGFEPAAVNAANKALTTFIDEATRAATAGADAAVTVRFEAGRNGSRRVRIGATARGYQVHEPLVFEAPCKDPKADA